MTSTIGVAGAVFAAATVLAVAVIVLRRATLVVLERSRLERETRLRPLALALSAGDEDAERETATLARRDSRSLAATLARFAGSFSGGERQQIAALLERRGDIDREIAELRSWRTWRRGRAAYLLGDAGSAEAVVPLLRVLADDSDRDVRSAAARSLGRLGEETAAAPLALALVEKHVPRAVASQALLAIGPAALPGLVDLKDHPEPDVRELVARLLGVLGGPAEAEYLHALVEDPSAPVRAAAARALGRIGDARASAALTARLEDRIPAVRAAAATALGALGDRSAVPPLLRIAREDDFEPARQAARAAASLDADSVRGAGAEDGPHLVEASDLLAAGIEAWERI
ncbi:MAG: hypothetical protein QOJ38_241 [Solirubrobacterales bacterium]|nr:hypothetical protein [Solirubrobacterales bacterium]